jgi:hypothetical protein
MRIRGCILLLLVFFSVLLIVLGRVQSAAAGETHAIRIVDYFNESQTNLVADSGWSEPVDDRFFSLRARMIIFEEYPPLEEGSVIKVYIELQNLNLGIGDKRVYFDIRNALSWEVSDSNGKRVPHKPVPVMGWAGPPPQPCWITLPYDSTVRLRANLNFGGRSGGTLVVPINGLSGEAWQFPVGDTNTYFVTPTVNLNPPASVLTNMSPMNQEVWKGKLTLPRTKLKFKP